MSHRIFIAIGLGAVLVSGCTQGDNSVMISPEEKSQIKSDPMPEKSKTGKPNLEKATD